MRRENDVQSVDSDGYKWVDVSIPEIHEDYIPSGKDGALLAKS